MFLLIVLLIFIIATPLVLLAFSLTARGRSLLAAFQTRLQSHAVFGVLLIALAMGQIAFIFADIGTFSGWSLMMLIIVLTIFLRLFLGRVSLDIRVIIVAGIWFGSIVLARQSLSQLLDIGSFWLASWRFKAIVLALSLLVALLAAAPIMLLSQRFFKASESLADKFPRHLGWLFIGALVAAFSALLLNQLTDFEHPQVVIVGRISIIPAALAASILALRKRTLSEKPRSNSLSDLPRPAYLAALVAIALGFLLVSSQISLSGINPDGLSYLTIARHYAEGTLVIRGYWSPLISWLLATGIILGANPIGLSSILTQLATLVWILMTVLTARRWGLSRYARVGLAMLVAFVSLTLGFLFITPDVLGAAIFSFGFYILANPHLADRPVRSGAILGLIVALSYFAKYYNLPFFIALIPVVLILLIARGENKANALKLALSTLAMAFLLLLPWLLGIWSRYGYPTITTSAAINRAIVGPSSRGHACWEHQLCATPSDVLFPWEDPQLQYYSDFTWSPFDSMELMRHQLRLLWHNSLLWIEPLPMGRLPIPPALLAALVILPFLSWDDSEKRYQYSIALAAFGLYAAGYLFTFGGDFRYYFAIVPLAWLAIYALIEKVLRNVLPPWLPQWAYSLLWVVILAVPLLSFSWLHPIRERVQVGSETCLEDAGEIMAEHLVAPMAGTDWSINALAYYTKIPALGAIPLNTNASAFDSQVRTFQVRTVLVPAEAGIVDELKNGYAYLNVMTLEVCGELMTVLQVP